MPQALLKIYFLSLAKVFVTQVRTFIHDLANARRRYICNVFFHWLRPCSAIDRKQSLVKLTEDGLDWPQMVPDEAPVTARSEWHSFDTYVCYFLNSVAI